MSAGVTALSRADVLPNAVACHAQTQPDKIFLVEVTGKTQTYAETDAFVRALAQAFAALGVTDDTSVLSFLPTSIDAVNVWLSLSRIGAIAVPINVSFDGPILAQLVENSKAGIMVCAARWLDRVQHVAGDLSHLQTIIVFDSDDGIQGISFPSRFEILSRQEFMGLSTSNPEVALREPELGDTAMLVYTSGTTGTSKGAMLPWGHITLSSFNMLPRRQILGVEDILYLPFPLFHVSGVVWLAAIARIGARVILREVFSTDAFWPDIRRHGCTWTLMIDSMAKFVENLPPSPDDAINPLRGATIVPALADTKKFERRFDLQTCTIYGSTEAGVVLRSDTKEPSSPGCGFPCEDFDVRLVDETDVDVAAGSVGELVVRPKMPWTIFQGYFENPEATLAANRNLWFHTGDLFRRQEDGEFHFVDRLKYMIRRRGENISSYEVERLVSRHPAILECAAIGVPSEHGEEDVKVVVVARPGSGFEPQNLIEFLLDLRTPRFMLPRFVQLCDAIPKTPTGKINKAQLGGIDQCWEHIAASGRTRSKKI